MSDINYRVLALDPGGSTGWASYSAMKMDPVDPGADRLEWYNEKWNYGTLGPEEHHAELMLLIENQHVHNMAVVCESFEFRQGKQRSNLNLISKEYIGVMKAVCLDRNIPYFMQTAAMGKGFVTNDKLKAMGLWAGAGKHKHAMDAMRHLVFYLVNKERRHDLIESWRNL